MSGMIVLGNFFIANLLRAEAVARRKGFKPLIPRFEVSTTVPTG